MQRYIQIGKLLLSLSLSLIVFSGAVNAAVIKIPDLPLGKVISLNGKKFIKVNNDPIRGSQFKAMEKVKLPCVANQFNGINMQDFTTDDCNCLPKPTGTGYTLAGVMKDARDGKTYEVRKFVDGKCWMVDNLRYGGASDACAGKTAFAGGGSSSPTNRFGTGTYGDCRNNPGSATYGYLYNWQAVMQHSSARYGSNYQPVQPTQGICPPGWHIPSGGTTGEFQVLHAAAGSPGTGFWLEGNWKGVKSGDCNYSGVLGYQGHSGYYFSSTQTSAEHMALAIFFVSSASPMNSSDKNWGFAVRCLKN